MSGDSALLDAHGLHGLIGRGGSQRDPFDVVVGGVAAGSISVVTQSTDSAGLAFRDNGAAMYVHDIVDNAVHRYNLGTPWDVTTATFTNTSTALNSSGLGLAFRPDGSRMYITENTGNTVIQYNLGTAWDVTTASSGGSESVSAQVSNALDVALSSDGTRMFVVDNNSTTPEVCQYTLSTPWDVTTSTTAGAKTLAIGVTNWCSVTFSADGTRMFCGQAFLGMAQYELGTAWNVTTATYVGFEATLSSGAGNPYIHFKDDGTRFYVVRPGSGGDAVYQYDLA